MPTRLRATTTIPTPLPIAPQTPLPTPGQAPVRRVHLGRVSSRSLCVMLLVRSNPITRARSTSCSPMAMTAVPFGVVLFAVVILRRPVTSSMLLIWTVSKALSTSVTQIQDTRELAYI